MKTSSSSTQKVPSLHPLLDSLFGISFFGGFITLYGKFVHKKHTILPGTEYNSLGKRHLSANKAPPGNKGADSINGHRWKNPIWKCLLRWMLNIPLFGEICIITGLSILAGWCSNPPTLLLTSGENGHLLLFCSFAHHEAQPSLICDSIWCLGELCEPNIFLPYLLIS